MKLICKHVQQLHAYVPGEQPQGRGLVKLNTNENPYPPSPKVLEAVKAAVDGRLRLYPNPTAQELREKLAKMHGVSSGNVIVGNGSDELLALATRAFVAPGKNVIQYFTPSYSLYPVLANIHNAACNEVALKEDFSLPTMAELRKGQWNSKAALTYVTSPNAPSGRSYTTQDLEVLCKAQKGVTILDEAYVDFAHEHAMALITKHSHVLVSRTFSKAYSLSFQRIGYFVGSEMLISALDKIRDSYNVNGLGQVAALATLNELRYYRANFQEIIRLREQVASALASVGFEVMPSQTNFLLVKPPRFAARTWQRKLSENNVLVRWFSDLRLKNYLRITIGREKEMGVLMRTVMKILKQ